jgi:uncharacterized membrane protein
MDIRRLLIIAGAILLIAGLRGHSLLGSVSAGCPAILWCSAAISAFIFLS